MKPHVEKLAEVFLTLPDENLLNLRHHLERRTKILCGSTGALFVDGTGGA